ncbi:hypothetical protein Alches_25340 [Alicyclobacillus hesperidum subsp. aegles]|nr:hypothetical protein Alches_25340 [Alicyclobacillus hesperidum subsp. aegles]
MVIRPSVILLYNANDETCFTSSYFSSPSNREIRVPLPVPIMLPSAIRSADSGWVRANVDKMAIW